MLATLADKAFCHDDWIFERVLAFRKDGVVRLMSRNEK
jgi:hypothetical protein